MVSICDDLRRLDKVLLHLSQQGSARNLKTYALLSSARRRVQALEKKARSLESLDALWCLTPSPNSSGGAAPMCAHVWPGGLSAFVPTGEHLALERHGRSHSVAKDTPLFAEEKLLASWYNHEVMVESHYAQ